MAYVATPLRLSEHRDALARLWAENMSDARIAAAIPARMRWLYEEAPDGPTTTVLVRDDETAEIVGCGSFLHRPTWVDGRAVRAGVLCDFAVARGHRNAGAALTVQRALVGAAREAGLLLLYGYPNAKSLAVFKRIGYQVVGQTTSWVKPLRSEYKVREALRAPWAATAVAVPIDAGLHALDALRSLRFRGRIRPEVAPALAGRAEALWERARGAYGVVGEKSSAYLHWRYAQFTTAEHHVFGAKPEGEERLAGYAVYDVVEGKAFVRELFVDAPDTAAPLLVALGEHLRPQRIASLSLGYLGSAAIGERLGQAGFFERPGARSVVVYPEGLPEALRARVFDPASWFMLDGELDI